MTPLRKWRAGAITRIELHHRDAPALMRRKAPTWPAGQAAETGK
jgi:hypothetical protein